MTTKQFGQLVVALSCGCANPTSCVNCHGCQDQEHQHYAGFRALDVLKEHGVSEQQIITLNEKLHKNIAEDCVNLDQFVNALSEMITLE